MRNKKKAPIICILIGLIFALSVNRSAATLVWEEDFENPPFNDWLLNSYDINGQVYSKNNYPPIIANGTLQMHLGQQTMDCIALHNSSEAYGTWSFDFHITEEGYCGLFFISNDYGGDNLDLNGRTLDDCFSKTYGYIVYIKSATRGWGQLLDRSITLRIWKKGWEYITLADFQFSSTSNLTGSHHMIITRDSSQGEFRVHFDSEHLFNATNNEIKTSEVIELITFTGNVSFDNLAVCDSVGNCPPTITTTTTTTQDTTNTTTTTGNGTFGFEFGVLLLVLVCSVFYVRKWKH